MAVYKRKFHSYEGQLTDPRFRFLVLSRYAFAHLFHSRLFVIFFVACFGAPVVGAFLIYLHYNAMGMQVIGETVNSLVPIDGVFFLRFLSVQTGMGLLLTVFCGPGLIAPDLANNALPLYFSRPFTRIEYVLGKIVVLLGLLSAITWAPLLLLFALQGGLAGAGWAASNLRVVAGIWIGSWAWILVLSLLALAFSAWVKWRPVAGFLIIGFFMVGAGFAESINNLIDTRWGSVFNTSQLLNILWEALFFASADAPDVPVWCAAAFLLAQCGLFMFLLSRRIRAYEVVR